MRRLNYFIFLMLGFTILFVFSGAQNAFAATNVSSTSSAHWAWNDLVGWINFYSVGNVWVSSTGTIGDASSSAGIISLDCVTHNTCGAGSSTYYNVLNDGAGHLSGWAWNDEYGWISFWSGNGGSGSYRVVIDQNGNFSGYAWNDDIGWISFNCNQPSPYSNTCATSNYEVQTSWVSTSTSGYLDSQTFDTGIVGGAQLNSVLWHGIMPTGASSTGVAVGFQFAVSNVSSGPWNFIGPNGVSNSTSSYWNANTPSSSVQLNSPGSEYNFYTNFRYFRYRITIFSNMAQSMTPRVDNIVVNWSP